MANDIYKEQVDLWIKNLNSRLMIIEERQKNTNLLQETIEYDYDMQRKLAMRVEELEHEFKNLRIMIALWTDIVRTQQRLNERMALKPGG